MVVVVVGAGDMWILSARPRQSPTPCSIQGADPQVVPIAGWLGMWILPGILLERGLSSFDSECPVLVDGEEYDGAGDNSTYYPRSVVFIHSHGTSYPQVLEKVMLLGPRRRPGADGGRNGRALQ